MGKDMASKKLELDELMQSLKEDEESLARLNYSKRERTDILERIKILVNRVRDLQAQLIHDADDISKNQAARINEEIESLQMEQARLNQRRKEIEIVIGQMEQERKTVETRNFDKYPCLANIRALVEQKGVKLGDIERAAGMTAGYMSRLEKEGNNSDPSVEFLVTAAKMLGVGLEELIYGKVGKLQPAEEKVFNFLQMLKRQTVSSKLFWQGWYGDDYQALNPEDEKAKKLHDSIPLLMVVNLNGRQYVSVDSMFERKDSVRLDGYCVSCDFSEDSRVIIMKCQENGILIQPNNFYEVYMQGADNAYHPLLSTKKMTENQLSALVPALYEEARKTISDVRLTPDVESMIDAFMLGRNIGK